ncbi:MAG: adenylate/guanylate cyclase domain-containing protein [Candidatus Bipolaricaulis sp.]|nr:adenylate/guanylate cyclase domain-containing protein [Candidatus Bipolaricaulis sp.]
MAGSERRLAAIMFTDIAGYSTLANQDEKLALELLEEHRAVIRPLVAHCEGVEVKTLGDGFLVEFPSALQAVACAIEVQRALRTRNATQAPERAVHVRIGIHLGDVEHREGDVLGDGVNIASRIQPLAEPGGICLSRQVFDQVENKLEAHLESLGPKALRHIARPVEVYRVVQPWDAQRSASDRPAAARLGRRSIAVLPFANLSSDPENAYFSDGLTEDLLAQLAKISALKVISRTSVMRYRDTDKALREIATELGVATVVEGTARRSGDRVRIVAQLIDAETDEHLWAETYDRDLTDIFAIQTELATQIAQTLEAQITHAEGKRIDKQPTLNMEAYTLCLRGRFHWNRRSKADLEQAVGCFRQAIALDPAYAVAHAGLSDALYILAQHGLGDEETLLPQAEAAARRAVDLDDTLAEAHAALAVIAEYRFDGRQAEASFLRAIELNPNYATARMWYALGLAATRRLDEALDQIQVAWELDPHSFVIGKNVRFIYYLRRQYDQVLAVKEALLRTEPDVLLDAHLGAGMTLVKLGRVAEAQAEFALHGERGPKTFYHECETETWLALTRELLGRQGALRKTLARWEEEPDRRKVACYAMAIGYFHLGERDQGFARLEEAFTAQRHSLAYLAVDPMFDGVRDDPRLAALVTRLGLSCPA